MKTTTAVTFIVLVFALGLFAGDTLQPTGYWWSHISSSRQLGYVEGYQAGQAAVELEVCPDGKNPAFKHLLGCILHKWRMGTRIETDTESVITTVSHFYEEPRNAPVRWEHAVLIAGAMVSGVPVSEEDLSVIRQFDAKL
jgi:hypothetical protein